jgi:hypothetical protein
MNTRIRLLPASERVEPDHSFITGPPVTSPLFAGWGPKL